MKKKIWFDAIEKNDIETVEKMIREGFDVNTLDEHGDSPFSYALHIGMTGFAADPHMIETLCRAGADVNFLYHGENLLDRAYKSVCSGTENHFFEGIKNIFLSFGLTNKSIRE